MINNRLNRAYLDDTVQLANRRTMRPGLLSENSLNYYVLRVRTKLGERAWNDLPVDTRDEPHVTRFKTNPKTYFLRLAFDC